MKTIDNAGLLLCDLQAQAFELSQKVLSCSSEIFIRRFMHSDTARFLDSGYSQGTIITPKDMIERVEEQYGVTSYGTVKYTANELFWIGYIYRYFSYTYELSSMQAYRIVKPKELRKMYPACHTMDCAKAIERILEAKDISLDMSIERQYQVYRRIRKGA